MEAVAKLRNHPTSPRKMRLLVDLIRGMKVDKALAELEHNPKDSWQTPFAYLNNEAGFEIVSFASDRKEGGSGDGADIFFSQCKK